MTNYNFLNHLILRSPQYSYNQYSIEKVEEILKDVHFQTAIYLASPQLYNIIASKTLDYKSLSFKEQLSIKRYYNRMSFRPTPFGSFSSFTLASWGPDALIRLDEQNAKLHLNVDQEIVLHLAERLIGNDLENSAFICNPALYQSGREFRFIKTNFSEEKKKTLFDLESYEYNALTSALIIFCSDGFKPGIEIITFMMEKTGCDRETAKDYLHFLFDSQIIIPYTATNIIGEDYLNRLLNLNYTEINIRPFQQVLSKIYEQLNTVPFPAVGHLVKLSSQLAGLHSGYQKEKANQFFYAGLERKVTVGSLNINYQKQITDGLKALGILSRPAQPLMLQQFIHDFKSRYDGQKIPLLQAIDPETGIGYGPGIVLPLENELLHQVNFNEPQKTNISLEWTAVHCLLLKKWNSNPDNTDPILLTEADLLAIPANQTPSSPPTLAILFRVLDDAVFLETVGGVSATALIGRFTAWNKDIHNLSQQLASLEQLANPEVIFADIGQLSDTHADNISRRKHSYEYEIPINSVSTLPFDHQIPPADLWISVNGDELVLESNSLQKVIIPRLSSAYNYSRNQLALFRILCDLQYQGLQGNYSFDLEQFFPGMPQYPRVVFKKTILCPAIWHLSEQDLKEFKLATTNEVGHKFNLIKEKLKLPSVIALSKFDQQLVFNTDKEEEVLFLVDCLKSMDQAILQEYFLPAQPTATTNDGKPLVSQFIAFLYKNEAVYPGNPTTDIIAKTKVKQEYILGSKWLYLKLYCNPATANDLLAKKLLPLLKKFDNEGLLSWFFIRYRDSGYHIRLRLKVKEEFIGPVLILLKKRLEGSVHYHLIREYQADTYRREMERYGADIIDLVEGFFHGSSELVIRYVKISRLKSFKNSYHSLALVSVTYLLNGFLPDINIRITFLEQMVQTFYSEFSNDKSLKIELDQKYREIKKEIAGLLPNQEYYEKIKLMRWSDIFELKTNTILNVASGFTAKRKNQLLADLIHMHLNRLFIDRQRNQELIIYYCLFKYQLSVRAMQIKVD
ncbi:lantibiotic dehydratase [Mucilaginibacter sp. 10I4]|uniref:lantibiotic dehydratase n=1 Tax=Mucilaginibacter sp. 10I4 TaxID=3048580 RepID=UPI002B2306B3|nr:lantibiotic dehydratase [Mucilaginibacter sp. 10I4]MEB0261813.1 lantibiotic dehydratase [Mucilaginibacter sp. 10I4]